MAEPVKFALLGGDSESVLLARVALNRGHTLVWGGDLGGVELLEPPTGWPAVDQGDKWEVLLDQHLCDAVIVGSGETSGALRAEQVTQLIKNDMAVLTAFPLCDSVLSYYQIDMARTETKATLYHFNPLLMQNNLLEQTHLWTHNGHPEMGAVEQVYWERPIQSRTQGNVLWHFVRDVEVLDRIAGPLERLGAVGSPDSAATYSGLHVQLLGKSQVPVHWTVGPVDNSPAACITLVGAKGKWKGEMPESKADRISQADSCLQQFILGLESVSSSRTTWPAALRAMELGDTIEISLRRGRIIDVHRQQLNEQLAFRGTMSALGCGLILVLPPILLLMGWLAGELGIPIAEYWAHGLLALLAVFLLVQLLPKLLFKPDEQNEPPE